MAPDTPLPYRLRSEIEWTPIRGRRRQWWVARDPLRSTIFRCGEEVRRLLQSLDGQRGIQDLDCLLTQGESKQRVSRQAIHEIVLSALQKQMLIPCIRSQADRSKNQSFETPKQENGVNSWLRFVQRSPWSLVQGKQRLGNAEGVLNALAKRTDWLFSSFAVYFWIAFIALSAALVFAKAAARELFVFPTMASIESDATHWLFILLATRVAHELGHAIVCVRMGARCREFGVFFMLGIACPYVDVTDSWRLYDPKSRMAIAAAGVYVEWIIAAMAGLVWIASQPCWLHALAWQVMVICSLTTLLINANPLMRYDGYFLLSDYLEVVNLREEAERAFANFVRTWCLGKQITSEEHQWSWQESGLFVYAGLSWLYRCTLITALVWYVYAICNRWQLPVLGWVFAILTIISFLLIPLGKKMFQSWSAARRTSQGPYRVVAMWLFCVALVVNIGWLPLPHRIACEGLVQPESRTYVYTQAAGRIPLVEKGTDPFSTKKGSVPFFVSLENPWIEDHARVAIQRQRQLECQIASTRLAAYQEPSIIDRLPVLSTLAVIAERQSLNAIKEVNALHVEMPSRVPWVPIALPPVESLDGYMPNMPRHTVDDLESCGQWLPAGTPIGYIALSERVSIAATVPISQLSNILVGMSARVRFDQLPNDIYTAKVSEISSLAAVPDDYVRIHNLKKSTNISEATDSRSFVSISFIVEGISQKTLAMGGTAAVVVWSTPKSLYHHITHLAGSTFGPNGLQTLVR